MRRAISGLRPSANMNLPVDDSRGLSKMTHLSRIRTAPIGTAIALAVAVAWVLVTRQVLEGPFVFVWRVLLVTLLSLAGFVTGAIQRFAPIVGVVAATLSAWVWAEIVMGPDPWIGIYRLYGTVTGVVCGGITGVIFDRLVSRAVAVKGGSREVTGTVGDLLDLSEVKSDQPPEHGPTR